MVKWWLPSVKALHNELERSTMLLMGKLTNFLWPCSSSQTVTFEIDDVGKSEKVAPTGCPLHTFHLCFHVEYPWPPGRPHGKGKVHHNGWIPWIPDGYIHWLIILHHIVISDPTVIDHTPFLVYKVVDDWHVASLIALPDPTSHVSPSRVKAAFLLHHFYWLASCNLTVCYCFSIHSWFTDLILLKMVIFQFPKCKRQCQMAKPMKSHSTTIKTWYKCPCSSIFQLLQPPPPTARSPWALPGPLGSPWVPVQGPQYLLRFPSTAVIGTIRAPLKDLAGYFPTGESEGKSANFLRKNPRKCGDVLSRNENSAKMSTKNCLNQEMVSLARKMVSRIFRLKQAKCEFMRMPPSSWWD